MKKLLTFFLTALLAFSVGWADEVTLDFTTNTLWNLPTTNTEEENSYSNGTYTITLKGTSGAGYRFVSNGSYLLLGKNGAYLTLPSFDKDVTKIEVVGRSGASGKVTQNIFVGETAVSTQTTGATGTSTFQIASNYQAAGTIYTLKVTNANNTQITRIVITLKESSTPDPTIFHKVTSTSDLVVGQKYIVVYEDGNSSVAMGNTLNSSNVFLGVTGLSVSSNHQIDISGHSDVQVMTLHQGSTSSRWALNTPYGYICGNNNAVTFKYDSSITTTGAQWTISANGIVTNVNSSDRSICYYASNSTFRHGDPQTGAAAYLYVEGEAAPLPVAQAPTFSPLSGEEFYSSLDVTITSATSGATIYYTTDGSTPTTSSSSIASGGIVTITDGCTIKAIAVASGYDPSDVAEATYTKVAVPVPTFSPNGGSYVNGQSVQVSISAVDGASIYYTLDGTDPVATRTAYTGPITISETTTLKAISVYDGVSSQVATAQFNFSAPVNTCPAMIVFDNTATTTLDGTDYHVSAGANYVMTSTSSTTYEEADGIRIGSGSSTGSLTLNLASDCNKVRKVVISAMRYGSDEGVIANVAINNGETRSADIANVSSFAEYTFDNFSGVPGTPFTTLTISNSASKKRFYIKSITIYYECTPVPSLSVNPPSVAIEDETNTNRSATVTVTAENLTGNVTTSASTNWNATLNQVGTEMTVTYNGYALHQTGNATVQSAADNVSATVAADYLYTGPIYIVGDVNDLHWTPVTGVQMDKTGDIYTKTITANPGGNGYAWLYFTKSLNANSFDNLGDNRFGPRCNDNYGQPQYGQNWEFNENSLNGVYCDLDTVYKLNTIRIEPGIYTITINPATNQFKIERYVINVTISPENGTTFTGPTTSGTISATPSDVTIEWSTDGTNWQTYTDGFTLTANYVGDYVTVYARAKNETLNVTSDVVSATYQRVAAPAPEPPVFSRGSGEVAKGTVITITAPEGCTLYVDGQQVNSPYEVTINHSTSISAYCVNSEGTPSTTVTNTYTIATVCEASIVFSGTGTTGDGQNIAGDPIPNDFIESGSRYINSSSTDGSVYNGKSTYGLKLGSSGSTGSFTINLNPQADGWQVTKIIVNALGWSASAGGELHVTTSANTNGSTQTINYGNGTINDFANYEFDFDGSDITSFTVSTTNDGKRCYVKSITLVYSCAPDVEVPVITPATGTYYENQTVTIACEDENLTIHYTTDGSEPTASSPVYNGEFTAPYNAGGTFTVKAIAIDEDNNESEVATATYTWGTPAVTIHPDSRNTVATFINVTLTGEPANGTIYYTTDGSEPSAENGTQYNGSFTVDIPNVGDAVTVKAVTVYNGLTSPVASATYTHVDKVVDVHAPFFSPLQNRTYYGDQTLQIGCTTPNADIYYEIVEVSGTTAPSASAVEDPTHLSTYYDGTPINMTAGNSYYVKAIAYIGTYVSNITEGYYIIKGEDDFQGTSGVTYVANCAEFNALTSSDLTVGFMNPVQVVYHSTYTNDGHMAEYCYVRDNTDYALIYFGKADTYGYHIFGMGDWIDGSQIVGKTSTSPYGYHIQLGTKYHEITAWPSQRLSEGTILPEETTCKVVHDGQQDGENSWGHYIHLRYTTLNNVADDSDNDPKHNGYIADQSGTELNYYDKFYRWSAGTCSYQNQSYTIHEIGDYDQAFFNSKQNAGATFDVYGVVDYFSSKGFQLCPIDFLWIYQPEISLQSGTYTSEQTVTITVTTPEWAAEGEVIYYKTDDMEDWAIYNGPITVNSDTHFQAYVEVAAHENGAYGGANYNDYVRSNIVEATYNFEGVEDPIITDHYADPDTYEDRVIEVGTVENIPVTVLANEQSSENAVTLYTTDGSDPRTSETAITLNDENGTFPVSETTTITAISYVEVTTDGVTTTLWSNPVTRTYTFVKKNGVEYDLVKTAPQEGHVYVIVNKDAYMGMSTTQNENNRASVGVMFKEGTDCETVYGNDELAQFVLESAHAGRYYFKNINGDGYLVVTTNANANLNTSETATSYSEAAVTIGAQADGYPATIMFNYDGTNRYMRYFANGRTFSTYSDASLNENVFLYGVEATPLAYIESTPSLLNKQVTVSDQLIGTWAVVNGNTKLLWAKDQGNASIDKRPAKTNGQRDYVKNILHYQKTDWDESNWVILDFSNLTGADADPVEFVGQKLTSASVTGTYKDAGNYKIELLEVPGKAGSVEGYPGWTGPFPTSQLGDKYSYAYNSYVPANFMDENLNHINENGKVVGFVADDTALPGCVGDSLYFMNPKIQEVAHIWAVWNGGIDGDMFTVYQTEHTESQNINAWHLQGTFPVNWTYNRLSEQDGDFGRPNRLDKDVAYEFHAVIMRPNRSASFNAVPQGTAEPGTPSQSYTVYPLDMPNGGTPTAVRELINVGRTVVGVTYFNLMGQESNKPFEGINIVVTRYSDGSTSATKVLR